MFAFTSGGGGPMVPTDRAFQWSKKSPHGNLLLQASVISAPKMSAWWTALRVYRAKSNNAAIESGARSGSTHSRLARADIKHSDE